MILNFELERELLGFGSKMRVLAPRVLVRQIKKQLQEALDSYETAVKDPVAGAEGLGQGGGAVE